MALGTEFGGLTGRNLAPIVIGIDIPVGSMVTVETVVIASMREDQISVFGHARFSFERTLEEAMAFAALVLKAAAAQP